MEKLRKPVLSGITKLITEIEEALHAKITDLEKLSVLLKETQEKQSEIFILDQTISTMTRHVKKNLLTLNTNQLTNTKQGFLKIKIN